MKRRHAVTPVLGVTAAHCEMAVIGSRSKFIYSLKLNLWVVAMDYFISKTDDAVNTYSS